MSAGGSMYTFLSEPMPSTPGDLSGGGPTSENTIKSKTGSNDDISSRLEAMTLQREKEFGGIQRK